MPTYERAGLRFDYGDHGPGATTRDVVVLLHGFPQDAGSYDAVVPLLVREGLRVLVPDQRGYSPGARPRRRSAYVLPELVGDVLALLDAAGVDRAHVVGHDWGGTVAWTLAGRHPERTLSLTALSTPHPAAMRDAVRHSDQLRRSGYMLWFQVPWLPEASLLVGDAALLRSGLRAAGLPAASADRYAARMREPGALHGALGWYRAIPRNRGTGPRQVHVPTVHLSGRHDPYFARHGSQFTGRHVRAPYRWLELDAGHWLPENHPREVADAVLSQRA